MSIDVKPHAYDPAANPELFEGVLARRVVAFVIDFLIIAVPIVLGAHVHFRLRHRHAGARLGALLAAAAGLGDLGHRLFRGHPRRPALGHHRHAGHGSGNAHLVRRAGLFRARRRARHRASGSRFRSSRRSSCWSPFSTSAGGCCTTSCSAPWSSTMRSARPCCAPVMAGARAYKAKAWPLTRRLAARNASGKS